MRCRSLVETKSKSLIRRTVKEEKLPTHLEMMKYIKEKYFDVTENLVEKIISVMTATYIRDILNLYAENELSQNKKSIIEKFLLEKTADLQYLYFGKEE